MGGWIFKFALDQTMIDFRSIYLALHTQVQE
jgi:hypothetical protein